MKIPSVSLLRIAFGLFVLFASGAAHAEREEGILRLSDNEQGKIEYYLELASRDLVKINVSDELSGTAYSLGNRSVVVNFSPSSSHEAKRAASISSLSDESGIRKRFLPNDSVVNAAVLLVNVPGFSLQTTAEEFLRNITAADANVASILAEQSYGRIVFTPTVFGPFDTDFMDLDGCNLGLLNNAAIKAAKDKGISLDSFNQITILFPSIPSCKAPGTATIGGSTVWIKEKSADDARIYLHELGHNFGMIHSSLDENGNGVIEEVEEEYGDLQCIMGRGYPELGFGYTLAHETRQEWLASSDPSQVISLKPRQIVNDRSILLRAEGQPIHNGAVEVVKISTNANSNLTVFRSLASLKLPQASSRYNISYYDSLTNKVLVYKLGFIKKSARDETVITNLAESHAPTCSQFQNRHFPTP